jgi:hypothetical protein
VKTADTNGPRLYFLTAESHRSPDGAVERSRALIRYRCVIRVRGSNWDTEEEGKPYEYVREPARSGWQRLKVKLLSLLPLAREL